jgi:hypothetical protein
MIFRAITATNDWTFGQGIAGYLTNEAAIEANIKTTLQSWVGDCFFAQQDFVDWYHRLDYGQQKNLQDELRTVVLRCFGVVAITQLKVSLNRITRLISITINMTTIFSPSVALLVNLSTGVQVAA